MICSEVVNLLYAGRIISATHVAFGSSRVMATCGNNGNALGTAAALCKRLSARPADLLVNGNMQLFQLELMKRGQYIPGYKLNDPQDLVRKASVIDSLLPAFELDEFPADGPVKVLTRSLAQMIPLPNGPVPTFEVGVQVVESTMLTVQLRGSAKPFNYTPEVIYAERVFNLDEGDYSLKLAFATENPHDQNVFLCLLANENVAVNTTLTRVSGLMSVEHECTQDPPSGIGIDKFERWTPVRRPMGHNTTKQPFRPLVRDQKYSGTIDTRRRTVDDEFISTNGFFWHKTLRKLL